MGSCKILFLAANPADTSALALDEEIREIRTKIRAADHRDDLELVSRWAVCPDDLLQSLNELRPHVVHFSGHGDTEELVLQGADGESKPVSKEALVALFRTLKDNIRLVVLNACYSEPQAEAIVGVVDFAVGMKAAIGDETARVFAASFYRALGFGRSVREAFDQGTTALLLEGIPEEDTPVFLVRAGADATKAVLAGTPEQFPGARPARVWNVPRRNPYFTGREDVLDKLHRALTEDGSAVLGQAIAGLGGIGKTQTAVEYCHRHRGDFEAVFWVRAEKVEETRAGFVDLARRVARADAATEDEVAVAAALDWLETNEGWLLVFDNADRPEVLKPFLPRSVRGRILLTSRAKTFAAVRIPDPLRVRTLPPEEARAFLLRRAGRKDASQDELAAVADLAAELGYLPLALEQAAPERRVRPGKARRQRAHPGSHPERRI